MSQQAHRHSFSPHRHDYAKQQFAVPPPQPRRFMRLPAGVSPSFTSSGMEFGMNPFEDQANLLWAIENVPLRQLSKGGLITETVPYSVKDTFGLKGTEITEADIGLSSTTPVLGQYAPTYGWPDDWGYFWEYVDARLFVPEVSFATKLKTRLVWKPGWEIDCSSEAVIDEIQHNWDKMGLPRATKELTANAMMWGTAYGTKVDNSRAVWATGYGEYDYALQKATGDSSGILYNLPAPLQSWRPPTKFYGLKILDSRTVRIQINPAQFDIETGDVFTDKYIQRRWAGPLGPTYYGSESPNPDISIHPDQMFCLKFNKIGGGIYGYSLYREVLFVLKGYLLMNQFLPQIVHRRADPLLHFKFGGNVKTEANIEITNLPTPDQIEAESSRYALRMPGQDIYSNSLLTVEEVYKGKMSNQDIIEYLRLYKERVLLGLTVPMSIAVLSSAGAEIKWGALNYEVLEDEITEYQQIIADEINRKVLPFLHPRSPGVEATFRFNSVHPEDWRADAVALLPWVQDGMITVDYALERMKMPPAEARMGLPNYIPLPQRKMLPGPDGESPDAEGREQEEQPEVSKTPQKDPASKPKERWLFKQTRKGLVAERLDNS